MRSVPVGLSAAFIGLLLLTACGQQSATSSGSAPGSSSASASGEPVCDRGRSPRPTAPDPSPEAGTDGVRVIGASGSGGGSAETSGDGSAVVGGGSSSAVRSGCVAYQVTNLHTEPYRYTITFGLRSDAGQVMGNVGTVVASVEPGRTIAGSVDTGEQPPGAAGWSQAGIEKVRSVPTDEAPAPGGPCPASGIRVYNDTGDAAMGLRVVSLHLENCGSSPYRIEGYPRLSLMDEDHKAVEGVRILHDGSSVAMSTGADGPARPLVLAPGEKAHAGLVWRNTVLDGTSVNAPYVRVWAKPGAAPVVVTPELDLGTTGRLAVGPWKRDE